MLPRAPHYIRTLYKIEMQDKKHRCVQWKYKSTSVHRHNQKLWCGAASIIKIVAKSYDLRNANEIDQESNNVTGGLEVQGTCFKSVDVPITNGVKGYEPKIVWKGTCRTNYLRWSNIFIAIEIVHCMRSVLVSHKGVRVRETAVLWVISHCIHGHKYSFLNIITYFKSYSPWALRSCLFAVCNVLKMLII
jgi:hypothetical protein